MTRCCCWNNDPAWLLWILFVYWILSCVGIGLVRYSVCDYDEAAILQFVKNMLK